MTAPIGLPLKRREDRRFLTGQGRYVDDLRLPDLLHAAIVRSPHAHARILGIDARRALAQPGVAAVLTFAELPECAAAVPPLAFSSGLGLAVAGILVWAVVLGIQESIMRAAIADVVPTPRRGTAFGVFAAGLGGAALVGGFATGALYQTSLPLLIGGVATVQVAALVLFTVWARRLPAAVR
jgi:hypothetical protein